MSDGLYQAEQDRESFGGSPVTHEHTRDCNGYALGSSCNCATPADCPSAPHTDTEATSSEEGPTYNDCPTCGIKENPICSDAYHLRATDTEATKTSGTDPVEREETP